MNKTLLFVLTTLAVLIAVSAQASASVFYNPQYHTYVLGFGNVDGGYTNTESSTYEKTSTEVETLWGTDSHVKIARTNYESFQPNYPSYVNDNSDFYHPKYDRYENENNWNNNPRYNWNSQDEYDWNDYYGYNSAYNRNGNVYYEPISDSNFRYKSVYDYQDYGNDRYGKDSYYSPRYDWHKEVYNWRY